MGRPEVILVDTHIVVWLALAPDELSAKAAAAIDMARADGDGPAISDISLLELAMLVTKGRINLEISLESFLQQVETLFVVLPISGRACARASQLPAGFPNDPADRIIAATAWDQGIALIAADKAIRRSKVVRTIW